jgi:hypothetical protein
MCLALEKPRLSVCYGTRRSRCWPT